MKALIFMNERIREPRPKGPMIRVQFEDGAFEDVHGVALPRGATIQTDPAGCKHIKTHTVKAWVEVRGYTRATTRLQGRQRVCTLR